MRCSYLSVFGKVFEDDFYVYVQLSYVLKKYFLLVNRNRDSNQSLLLRPESELF